MGKLAVSAAGLLLLIPMLVGTVAGGVVSAVFGSPNTPTTATAMIGCATGAPATGAAGYQADQLANAATIVAVGKRMGVPEQGQVAAIAAALTESGLRNLDYGDRDSLGLFQQRPSQGWGTPAEIMTPGYAATQFYQHLLAVPGWQSLSVSDAAQAVQRSARPTAYGSREPAARAIVAAVDGGAVCSAPSSAPLSPAMPVAPRAAG